MKLTLKLSALALVLCASQYAEARDPRQVTAFRRHNPCPKTHKLTGACPGWVVDHFKPLCAGGADLPSNMRWQEYRASLIKDAQERRLCRSLKGAA
jgi:hypothetical protein